MLTPLNKNDGFVSDNDSRATATLETKVDFSRVVRKKGKSDEGRDEKLYEGMNGYRAYGGGSHGPLRASAHVRASTRFDYQPDIYKDYKETGYCGYGDSCKFAHDRGEYKSGPQLEEEWNESEKARKRNLALKQLGGDEVAEHSEEGDNDDSLPFVCFICRQPFVDPVVTKRRHYFCERCVLKHHAKNKKCFVCNTPTLGIFNTAHEIHKRTAVGGRK